MACVRWPPPCCPRAKSIPARAVPGSTRHRHERQTRLRLPGAERGSTWSTRSPTALVAVRLAHAHIRQVQPYRERRCIAVATPGERQRHLVSAAPVDTVRRVASVAPCVLRVRLLRIHLIGQLIVKEEL